MTLLNPAGLIFGALVPVVFLLYLLKVRRVPARVSTLMFWQRVTGDQRRRALFQRLRNVFSLLLQLLILGLILFALARPELSRFRAATVGSSVSTVVILDCRARMQADGPGGSAFVVARRTAENYLRRASSGNMLALLACGSAPEVIVGFSDDEAALLEGLDRSRVTDATGSTEDAIRLAASLLELRVGERRIVLISDRSPNIASTTELSGASLELRNVVDARERENVGLTNLTARPLPNSPQTAEVFLEVENFGRSSQTGSIEVTLDGTTVDVKPYHLEAGEHHTEIYPALAPRPGLANARGLLKAHLVPSSGPPDALPLDDDAYAVIPPFRRLRILLVTRGNWFLEGLFKADEGVDFNVLAPEGFEPAQAASFDAVVLDDLLPLAFSDLAHLPAGNFLFVKQAPLPPVASGETTLVHPLVTELEKDSPLLRLVELRDMALYRAQGWDEASTGNGWRFKTPVRSEEHPLVVTGERPATTARAAQRFIALAFGVTDSVQLPLRVAFPLFIQNCVLWLANRGNALTADADAASGTRTGEILSLESGETLWTKAQSSYCPLPGRIPPAELLTGPASFQTEKNGFYLRRDATGAAHWLAINTNDREMSALDEAAPMALAARPAILVRARLTSPRALVRWWQAAAVWPPWAYLAAFALIVCTLEWWSFHRRRTE